MESNKKTAQELINSIRNIINSTANDLMENNNNNNNNGVSNNLAHPFSTINVEEQQLNFKEQISKLRVLVHQYHRFTVTEKEATVRQYLTLLKDHSITCAQAQNSYDSIAQCQNLAREYMAKNKPPSELDSLISVRRKIAMQAILINSLVSSLTASFGLYCDVGDLPAVSRGEKPSSTEITITLSSNTFVVDLILQEGVSKEAKLLLVTNNGDLRDPDLDKELSLSVAGGDFSVFQEKIKYLCHLDEITQKYPDLQPALRILNNDLIKIGEFTKIPKSIVSGSISGFGVVEKRCEGVYLQYYVSPLESLNLQKNEPSFGQPVGLSVLINLELSKKLTPLPRVSLLSLPLLDSISIYSNSNNNNNQTTFFKHNYNEWFLNPASMNQEHFFNPVGALFVCVLKPPLPMSILTLNKIMNITSGREISIPNLGFQIKEQETLERTLAGNIEGSKSNLSTAFQYVHSGNPTASVLVGRIPFGYPHQLFPILQILKQQAVFNELFRSCFAPSSAQQQSSESSSNKNRIAEIVTEPPHSITITFLHPITYNLLSLGIIVSIGGSLKASLYTHHTRQSQKTDDDFIEEEDVEVTRNDPPLLCSESYITKILERCHSIPLTLEYVIKKQMQR